MRVRGLNQQYNFLRFEMIKESEKDIEKYLREKIKSIGGKAYKFVSPGNNGVPDRLICLPGGKVIFAELKSTGCKPTALQTAQIHNLRMLGFSVRVIDSKQGVNELMNDIVKGLFE